jgi:hypothetical protein
MYDPSEEYIPPNLRENIFSNQEIDGIPSEDEIPVTENDWEDFMEPFDGDSDEDMETTDWFDSETFYRLPVIDYDGYRETMDSFEEGRDDFYGILPDEIDYEDPVDKTYLID